MRWVVLSDDWPPQLGGVATWGFGAAHALAQAGHRVVVFARRREGLLAPPGVEVVGVPGRSFQRRGGVWAALRGLPEIVRADAVLATTWTMATGVYQPLARLGMPLHVVFHGSGATRPAIHEKAFARVTQAARCWAVSRFLVRTLADRGVSSTWIPSPVEPRPGRFDPDGPWLMVARATPLKGGRRFIDLVAAAGASGWLIGDGPELSDWKTHASRVGAPVRFLGALDRHKTRALLDGAACSVLLSRADADGTGAEGLGLVLLEAAASGVLSVGSGTGGIPEVAALTLEEPDDPIRSAREVRDRLATWHGRAEAGEHGLGPLAAALTA